MFLLTREGWFCSLVYIATNKTYDIPYHSQRQLQGTSQPQQTRCNLPFVTLFTLSRLSSLLFWLIFKNTKTKAHRAANKSWPSCQVFLLPSTPLLKTTLTPTLLLTGLMVYLVSCGMVKPFFCDLRCSKIWIFLKSSPTSHFVSVLLSCSLCPN